MEILRHIAESPIGDIQSCSRCGHVIEKTLAGGQITPWKEGEPVIVIDGNARSPDFGNWSEAIDCDNLAPQ